MSVIFCCGMRRSASTLQYHLTRELLPHYTDLGWITWQEFRYVPDSILKCHPYIPDFNATARYLFEIQEAKAIYIYRDIRDVVASMVRLGNDNGYSYISNLEDDVKAIILAFYKWTSVPDVHISRYEDLDIEQEVVRLARFFGVKPKPGLAKKYSLDRQRRRQPKAEWDAGTTMHPHHCGTGEAGQWRVILTQEQLGTIYKVAGGWLKEMNYE